MKEQLCDLEKMSPMKFFVLLGSTLLLSVVCSASIVCPISTYDFYASTVNASGGCTINSNLFDNFQFANPGTPSVTASNVTVTPVSAPNVGFQFGLPLNTGVGSNLLQDVALSYTATAPSTNPFTGFFISQVGGFAGSGNATVQDAFCLGAACVEGTTVNAQTQQNVIVGLDGGATSSTPFASSATTLGVVKDISISTGPNGVASLAQATDILTQAPSVPEPASMFLMGSGLLALGFLGHRSRKARPGV